MLNEATKKIRAADHMLTMTYPLVKDPKLLIAVLENINESMDKAIHTALQQERENKNIQAYPNTQQGRLNSFQLQLAKKYQTPKELLRSVQEVRETVEEHKNSPVEFRRKESFVICDESYKIRTLNEEILKKHIKAGKNLISHIQEKTPWKKH